MENDTARLGKEPTCHGLNGSPLPSFYIFLVISTWNFEDRNESTGSHGDLFHVSTMFSG